MEKVRQEVADFRAHARRLHAEVLAATDRAFEALRQQASDLWDAAVAYISGSVPPEDPNEFKAYRAARLGIAEAQEFFFKIYQALQHRKCLQSAKNVPLPHVLLAV